MIRNSFLFLPGIRAEKERKIWADGATSWGKFLEKDRIAGISKLRKPVFDTLLKNAQRQLEDYNSSYFAERMPSVENWRLYDHFEDDAVFLDIETSNYHGNITIVGLYDGRQTMQFVRGFNLDKNLLKETLSNYKLLITFNGRSFDVPVINKYFNNIVPQIPHIDLRHVARKINLVGGLKSIERQLGIGRPDDVVEMDGEDAIMLWAKWQNSGDRKYLDLLARYNEEDIINLKPLMKHCYGELSNKMKENFTSEFS